MLQRQHSNCSRLNLLATMASFRKGKALTQLSLETLAKKGSHNELLRCIEGSDSDKVIAMLDQCTHSESHTTPDTTWDDSEDANHTTALHVILAHRPSVEVVDALCRKLRFLKKIPIPEDFLDKEGRNPLHVATLHGCDVAVINRLLSGRTGNSPATTIDNTGRTPLHHVCLERKNRFSKCSTENALKVMSILIDAYPYARAIPDNAGMTPLKLAFAVQIKDQRALETLKMPRRGINGRTMSVDSLDVTLFYDSVPTEFLATDAWDGSEVSFDYAQFDREDFPVSDYAIVEM